MRNVFVTKSLFCTFLVDLAALGLQLDSMLLKVFSNLKDSVILFYDVSEIIGNLSTDCGGL